ncbi:NlpC/P60 family protein [Actinoplanes sp. NPDC049265]|uniref:C40 family peptidase n=1 Tax=Actinoplanes sp. NPDC049265 TaxID=3363902 RepID=UPI0037242EF7
MSRAARRLISVLAVLATVLVIPKPAVATPGILAEPTPGAVEKQIDQQWDKLEPVIEKYNKVHGDLQANRKKLDAIQKRLTPLEVQVNVAMGQVREQAAQTYMQGSPSAMKAMLLTGNATGLTDKLEFLDQFAKHQRNSVKDVVTLKDQLSQDKQDLDTLTKTLATQDAGLAKSKAGIQKQVDELQKMRLAAYGKTADDGPLRLGPCPATYTKEKGNRAAQRACSLIGKPYIFGAIGPGGYDCSGLTMAAWDAVGVHLSHYTGDQIGQGRAVSRSELQVGDLVFYPHHVAIYVGGGKIVHAPHTGDHVRMADIDRMNAIGYRRPG